jgi:50S ribosomal subunit-associated GTPase HflX
MKEEKTAAAEDTLRAIHADEIPVIRVMTKADRIPLEEREPGSLYVSSVTGEGIEELLSEVIRRLYPDEKTIIVCVPYEKSGLLQMYRAVTDVIILEERETGYLARITGEEVRLRPFMPYEVKEYEEKDNCIFNVRADGGYFNAAFAGL